MMTEQIEFRNKIKDMIEKYGTPQSFIANKCNVSRACINLWVNDKKALPNEVFLRLEKWYNSL